MSGSPIGVPPFRAALQGELGDRSGTAKKVQVSLLSLMLLSGGCQLIDIIPFTMGLVDIVLGWARLDPRKLRR